MMKTRYFVWVLAGLLLGSKRIGASSWLQQAEQKPSGMDTTDKAVSEKFEAFAKQQDPARIYEALEIVETAERDIPARDVAENKKALARWLSFFAGLDRSIDPHWDPNRLPVKGAPLPPDHGVVFPSGEVDPSTIPDPVERATYIEVLRTNKDYARRYSIQLQVRRIDERATRDFERLIAEKYATPEAARQEFEQVLAASPLSESRKKRLRGLMPKPE
jgi:hypothetical protein